MNEGGVAIIQLSYQIRKNICVPIASCDPFNLAHANLFKIICNSHLGPKLLKLMDNFDAPTVLLKNHFDPKEMVKTS